MSSPNLTIIKYQTPKNVVTFSTKRGNGTIASDPYSGFSTCNYTGDSPEKIRDCHFALSQFLDVPSDRVISPRQTHSTNVVTVNCNEQVDLEGVDGLVTSERRLALVINTADCVPVLMADSTNGVIAAVHSGWRGTVGKISGKAVEVMKTLGADPRNIMVWMGPSICADCFEVGEEVAEQFGGFDNVVLRRLDWLRPHVNLPEAIRQTLVESGIGSDKISLPTVCSFCNHGQFFSARRLGVKSGRTLSVIMLQ